MNDESHPTGGAGAGCSTVTLAVSAPNARARAADRGPAPGTDGWYAGAFGPPDADDAPEPRWALRMCADSERERLTAAATGQPGGWSAEILHRHCPDGREGHDPHGPDAAGLIDGITGLQRLINWAQACQQRYLAALARPGVALPVTDLIDLAESPLGLHRPLPDAATPASALTDPTWGPAIREAALKLAAVHAGCALHLAPVTARSRTERAVATVDHLPATLAAQQAGDLDGYRASIIYDRTLALPPDRRHIVEESILPAVADRTPSRVRELVDRHVTRADPDAAARRAHHAARGRGVRTDPGEDGMACLRADLPAADAQLTVQVLDHIAATISAAGLAHGRGRSQIRADVFTDLFRDLAATGATTIDTAGTGATGTAGTTSDTTIDTGTSTATSTDTDTDTDTDTTVATGTSTDTGTDTDTDTDTTVATGTGACTGATASADDGRARPAPTTRWPAVPVHLNVYIHAATLAGDDNNPAELAGHGAITAGLARTLAESATTIRAVTIRPPGTPPAGHATNPTGVRWCGGILDVGRTVYRPPAALTDHITTRDRTCAFPGCRAPAHRCDLDHRLPWHAGGATCSCNLDSLCRFHHLIKTFTPWRATRTADGTLTWTSPTGHRYPAEPGHPLLDGPDAPADAPRTGRPPPPTVDAADQPPPF